MKSPNSKVTKKMEGDCTIRYPLRRAFGEKHGPIKQMRKNGAEQANRQMEENCNESSDSSVSSCGTVFGFVGGIKDGEVVEHKEGMDMSLVRKTSGLKVLIEMLLEDGVGDGFTEGV